MSEIDPHQKIAYGDMWPKGYQVAFRCDYTGKRYIVALEEPPTQFTCPGCGNQVDW